MAIEVRVPKEITEYKEKIIFGMSWRQLACTAIALVVAFGSYFLLSPLLGSDITVYLVFLINVPVLAFGFYQKNGLRFEKLLFLFLRHQFAKNKRPYKTQLYIQSLEKKGEKKNDQKGKAESRIGEAWRTEGYYPFGARKEDTCEIEPDRGTGTTTAGNSSAEGEGAARTAGTEGTGAAGETGSQRRLDFGSKGKAWEQDNNAFFDFLTLLGIGGFNKRREVKRAEITEKEKKENLEYIRKQIEGARKEYENAAG